MTDVAGGTEIVDNLEIANVFLTQLDPLTAGMDSLLWISGDIFNLGPKLELPSLLKPLYIIELHTDDGTVLTDRRSFRGLPPEYREPMETGQKHHLQDVEVGILEVLSILK